MQTFMDSATNKIWQFEDDVIVTNVNGIHSFKTASGMELTNTPITLQPYTIPAPTAAQLLAQAQTTQTAILASDYRNAIIQPISFTTAAGVTKSFQADPVSIQNMSRMLSAYTPGGVVPPGFYWVAADNTQVPFLLADLQGLAKTLGERGWAKFANLQVKKAYVMAATTITAVESVTW